MLRDRQAGILLSCVLLLAGCDRPIRMLPSHTNLSAEPPPAVVHVPVGVDVLIVGDITTRPRSTATAEFYHVAAGKFLRTGSLPTRLAELQMAALGSDASAWLSARLSGADPVHDLLAEIFVHEIESLALVLATVD